MSGNAPVEDRRATRRTQTIAQIVDAAWELGRERGIGGWTMRDLGARVGMRAQSLYVYFPSKFALLDHMFATGFAELIRRMDVLPSATDPDDYLRRRTKTFVDFAVEDMPRYQLLFQRVVPGFEPSVESYEVAVDGLNRTRAALAACGIRTSRGLDLYTALVAGLAAQQNSNEPGGTRWVRLVDEAVDMYLAHLRRTARGKK
jgi:AcrR family transcriptional regulator